MARRTMRGPTSPSIRTSRSGDALHEVLSLCLEHVGIKSLARFGACSKRSRELSKSICQQHTRQLLPPLVKLASRTGFNASSTCDKVVAAIDWVVACAGAAALAGLADTLLAIPRVPRSIAFKLINCGVCVSWEQLKAAVRSRIAGIEGWGAGRLMPFMVVAVCSIWGDHQFMHDQLTTDECWLCTPASDIPDLLRLAVNNQKPEGAQGLLQLLQDEPAHQMQQLRIFHHQNDHQNEQKYQYRMSQQLQAYQQYGMSVPQLLQQQQQMQEAWHAVQQHHLQVQLLLRDRPQQLKQLLTTDLVVELLRTAALRGHWAVMRQLFELDAAQFITADVAAELLHAAVQRRSVAGLEVIIKQQAAKQVSAGALCSLMNSTLQTAFQSAWPKLLQLPAAPAINAAGVLQLLRQGIEMQDASAVHNICKLSSASTLSAGEIVNLLQHGFARNIDFVIKYLIRLPSALLITTGSMVVLLQIAMQQADITAVEELMKVDVVHELDSQQLGQLCKLAMAVTKDSTCLEMLLQLPAADDLAGQIDDLVEAALQQSKRSPCCSRSSFESLEAVLQLSAADKLHPLLICECLEQLVQVPDSDDLIDMLCFLENAHTIEDESFGSNDRLNNVILTALQLHRVAAADSISELTSLNDVGTEVLQDLLSTAIEQKQEDLAVKLCYGSTAQELPSSALVRMLRVATRQRLCKVIRGLLVINATADVCGDLLAGLIKEELNAVDSCTQHTESCILDVYIALDAAALVAPMHWSQIAELMCLAIQQHKDHAVAQLCNLSGAQDPTAWQLLRSVLHVALQRGGSMDLPADSFIVAVCQLPAAKHLSVTSLKSLMEAAIRGGGAQILLQLCQLPAAAELDANAVVELGVIGMHCATGMPEVLSTLPGAALTTRQDLLCLLRKAMATEDACVSALLYGRVRGWCFVSVRTRFGASKLGAAEKLLPEDIAELLLTSLICLQDQEIAADLIEALSKLPAAQHLSPDQLFSFLQTAIELGLDLELQSLCELHEKVMGPMSDDLICKLRDAAETCTPRCSAEVLAVLSGLHNKQKPSGFVCGLL